MVTLHTLRAEQREEQRPRPARRVGARTNLLDHTGLVQDLEELLGVERCHRITRFIAPGREAFMASEELQDAVIRNVEVIGEAAKRVSAEARSRMSSLDWKGICGMRDVLIHDYIGVDLDEVWNVVSSRIPELQAVLEQFLARESQGPAPGSMTSP